VKRFCALLGLLMLLTIILGSAPAAAQDPIGTPSPMPTATPNRPDPEAILLQAQRAAASADQASNIVNTMLQFIQVVGIVGGALAAIGATAFASAGFRTLSEYRSELSKARAELDTMRIQLQTETQQIRSQGDRAIRALTLLQLGEQQLEAKNTKAALRTYLEAFNLDPENRATNYFLGELYVQEKELAKGIEHLERALASGSSYPPAEAALAFALRLQGDRATKSNEKNRLYAESEARFLKALDADPAVIDISGESVHAVLGGLYKKWNRIPDAISAYEAAEKVTPQKSYPIVNLAVLYFTTGKPEIAENYFKRSAMISARILDGNPFDFWARFDLITALIVLKNEPEAQRHLELVLPQLQIAWPLETFLGSLNQLKNAPQPPDHIDKFIEQVQRAVNQKQS
jgi:tetratricopeptide (TPR) repeat protein